MRAITLTQPWATLVAIGAKRIETRSWSTPYRGPLAIHAAAGLGPVDGLRGLRTLISQPVFFEALRCIVPNADQYCDVDAIIRHLPFGGVVAVCDLADVRTMWPGITEYGAHDPRYGDRIWELTAQERAFRDYTPGRYAWLLDDVQPLPEPIPAKGQPGLWEWAE